MPSPKIDYILRKQSMIGPLHHSVFLPSNNALSRHRSGDSCLHASQSQLWTTDSPILGQAESCGHVTSQPCAFLLVDDITLALNIPC